MSTGFDPSAIAARLREALAKSGRSKRSVEVATGLSRGYMSRLTKPAGYGDITVEIVGRLALALGVREAWLAYGDGAMFASAVPDDDDPYPNRRALKHSSHWSDASESARRYISGIREGGGDLSLDDWLAELRAADRRVKRGERLDVAPTPEAEEDVVIDPEDAQ